MPQVRKETGYLMVKNQSNRNADFLQPMEYLSVSKLPDGQNWVWEIKLDGYRAIAVKNSGKASLWSRNRKSLNRQFPQIAEALAELPEGTVLDGEVVAMGDDGRPNFNLLQNFKSEVKRIRFFVFDRQEGIAVR